VGSKNAEGEMIKIDTSKYRRVLEKEQQVAELKAADKDNNQVAAAVKRPGVLPLWVNMDYPLEAVPNV
jgi:hypothetical protein